MSSSRLRLVKRINPFVIACFVFGVIMTLGTSVTLFFYLPKGLGGDIVTVLTPACQFYFCFRLWKLRWSWRVEL